MHKLTNRELAHRLRMRKYKHMGDAVYCVLVLIVLMLLGAASTVIIK